MSNYTKTTDFEAKDSLPTGDSGKIIRGAEFETEFDAISTAIATKADTAGPTFTGTLTFETISDGTINVTAFVDEDDMSSDSATLVPTQQSVKAYVDSQVTAQDLDFQADTGGALSIDLDSETMTFTGGTGIDTSGSGNAVTFAIDSTVATLTGTQTLTNKTLTSPDVNTPDIDGGTIDGTVIGGTTPAAVSATTVSATGNITVDGTVDGRDVAADGTKLDGIESGATADQTAAEIRTLVDSATDSNVFTDADHTKLDGIEASADVTDTANVTAAGALMDSELTSEASVKALNQGVATTDSPTFAGLDVGGTIEFDGLSGTGSVNVTDILDQDDMSSNSATALATQQSIKAYVDSTVAATNELVEDTTPQLGGDLDLNSHDITGTGNIDVTGSISADGLTVDVADQVIINHSGDGGGIRIDSTNGTNTGSLRFGDDLDNYIGAVEYNHSTNTLSLYADNATRVAVDSSGIDVTGTATATKLVSANGVLELDDNGTHNGIINSPASLFINIDSDSNNTGEDFVIGKDRTSTSGGTELFRVQENGNVGIGTTSPLTICELEDVQAQLTIDSTGSSFSRVVHQHNGTSLWTTGTRSASDYHIYRESGSGNVIVDAGNVGIGTTNPLYNLVVSSGGASGIEFGPAYSGTANLVQHYNRSGGVYVDAVNDAAQHRFNIGGTERMRIDSSGNVGIGRTSSSVVRLSVAGTDATASNYAFEATNSSLATKFIVRNDGQSQFFKSDNSASMTLTSDGNLLVGTTTVNGTGITLGAGDYGYFSRSGDAALFVNRSTSDGSLIELRKADVAVGSIGTSGGDLTVDATSVGILKVNGTSQFGWASNLFYPTADNARDLGTASFRFDDIYATNGTIQTSDRNEKQDIEALLDAEQRVAVAAKSLLRKYRWKSAVEEKGDDARIHFGIIAQDLQDAFTAEGLDAGRYGMFINSTWTDEETGEERSRMGVRYSELLAFIISAI